MNNYLTPKEKYKNSFLKENFNFSI